MLGLQQIHPARLTLLTLFLLLTPLLAVVRPQPALAAGVVSQCTETALRAALEGGGLVTFSCSGTIPIAGELVIEADTVIDGGGVVTLDGGGTTRLIQIVEGVALEVRGLTLRNGFSEGLDGGGAILNFGTLTVTAGTLSGNFADFGGAIDNYGEMTLADSTLNDNQATDSGGAIYLNPGALATITGSELRDNSGLTVDAWGGAIVNDGGALTIVGSMLTGNSVNSGEGSSGIGGAIASGGGSVTIASSTLAHNSAVQGGAVFAFDPLTITASTLNDNHATGAAGAVYVVERATITASTISGNHTDGAGGAFYTRGPLSVTSSTLAHNSAGETGSVIYNVYNPPPDNSSVTFSTSILTGDAPSCAGDLATITSGGYNVASDATCNLTAAGDLQNADPQLGPLMNNGGPTETMLPELVSPAVDRVPNALCVSLAAANDGRDQRGAARPESDGVPCDSGSVELQVNSFFCVGERSGSLRYVSVPNDCVRGEYRLTSSPDGQYVFCVGDRSGSMRYLSNGGASCVRGEWELTLPQDGPITICVGERSRTARFVAAAGQCNARGELVYIIVNPAG